MEEQPCRSCTVQLVFAGAQSNARFSVFPAKSIRRGPLGSTSQPSGLKSRGSGCPQGSPAFQPRVLEDLALSWSSCLSPLAFLTQTAHPPPLCPSSCSCRLSLFIHLPSNLAGCVLECQATWERQLLVCNESCHCGPGPVSACTALPCPWNATTHKKFFIVGSNDEIVLISYAFC